MPERNHGTDFAMLKLEISEIRESQYKGTYVVRSIVNHYKISVYNLEKLGISSNLKAVNARHAGIARGSKSLPKLKPVDYALVNALKIIKDWFENKYDLIHFQTQSMILKTEASNINDA